MVVVVVVVVGAGGSGPKMAGSVMLLYICYKSPYLHLLRILPPAPPPPTSTLPTHSSGTFPLFLLSLLLLFLLPSIASLSLSSSPNILTVSVPPNSRLVSLDNCYYAVYTQQIKSNTKSGVRDFSLNTLLLWRGGPPASCDHTCRVQDPDGRVKKW